ncbi:MAG TPA: hypothetical protein VKR58_15165, partial [Aquella sp.]|nr:hypothetical protein [Aquella sp.]
SREKLEAKRRLYLEASAIRIYKEPTLINKSATLVYAETSGSDFYSVLKMPDVDITRSYSNDMREILLYFGIEAVRSYIIRDLIKLVKMSDTYIDPRHTTLIADWMTAIGMLTPLTPKGMKKHELGALANAAFREPMKGFKNETMYNKIDRLSGITGPLTVGNRIEVGTGIVETVDVDLIKIKSLIDSVKKQDKKISTSLASKIVSLLESPDFANPLDAFSEKGVEFTDLTIPVDVAPIGEIEISEVPGVSFSSVPSGLNVLTDVFPIVSNELKVAVENNVTCEPASVQLENRVINEGSVYRTTELPLQPVTLNQPQFTSTEKPPEIKQGLSFNLDDLI